MTQHSTNQNKSLTPSNISNAACSTPPEKNHYKYNIFAQNLIYLHDVVERKFVFFEVPPRGIVTTDETK